MAIPGARLIASLYSGGSSLEWVVPKRATEMTQDTRKDKRAKIVSLNVRYKSATVDEFIENHSHDVSKGGIFIKTPTPFPPGTLIKFEIRIANDKAVIMGVGRVVWKREASQSAGDRPSGMGVKFIKIDDSSRTVIDRVVAEKEGAGSAYATEAEALDPPIPGASRVPSERVKLVSGGAGLASPGRGSQRDHHGHRLVGRPSERRRSASILGGSDVPDHHERTRGGPPPKERTVMKQAAELLEEALKEAGGSMEEIGTNPLFVEGNRLEGRVGTAAQLTDRNKKGTLLGLQAAPIPAALPAPKPASDPPSGRTSAATKAAPEVAKVSATPPTARESPSAKMPIEAAAAKPRRTDRPGASASPLRPQHPTKTSHARRRARAVG